MISNCPSCSGKGHKTEKRGEDVHIIDCTECDGWGSVDSVKVISRPKHAKPKAVDLDALLSQVSD